MPQNVYEKRASVEYWLSHLRARAMPDDVARHELDLLLALYYNAWERKGDFDLTQEGKVEICTAYNSLLCFLNRFWDSILEANGGRDIVTEYYRLD